MKVSSQPECWKRSARALPIKTTWSLGLRSRGGDLGDGDSAAEVSAMRTKTPNSKIPVLRSSTSRAIRPYCPHRGDWPMRQTLELDTAEGGQAPEKLQVPTLKGKRAAC